MTAGETVDAFMARMAGDAVPAGQPFFITEAETLPLIPMDQWAVDWVNGSIVVTGVPKPKLYAYAAAKRYAAMISGVRVGGALVPSDDLAASRIKDKRDLVKEGLVTTPFNMVLGTVTVQADLAFLTAAVSAIGARWQACFDTQSTANAQITAGTVTTYADIDAAVWPAPA